MTDGERNYHHGNLRAALVDAALAVLENDGSPALSLRAIAAAAGVSRAAPYAHFRDRAALLSAVAGIGFDRLAAAMAGAADSVADAEERFVAIGRAYVQFALDNPNLFKLMFSAELGSRAGQSAITGSKTYELFRQSFAALARDTGHAAPDLPTEAIAWSMIHGLSLLLVEERLPVPLHQRAGFSEQVTREFVALFAR